MKQKKVYVEIVQRIQEIIEQDELKVGDKIPSERELAARLGVGRSSVREALRSLELLGLIETRVGGGTFIRNFGEHHLVQLVGAFILLDDQTKKDLIETKGILEKEAIVRAASSKGSLKELDKIVSRFPNDVTIKQAEAFNKVLMRDFGNNLVFRVWSVSNDYFLTMFSKEFTIEKKYFENIMSALKQQEEDKAITVYKQLVDNIYAAL